MGKIRMPITYPAYLELLKNLSVSILSFTLGIFSFYLSVLEESLKILFRGFSH